MSTITDILNKVESSTGKLVVLYLYRVGTATVDQMADYLAMKKMSVYSTVKSLCEKDILAPLEHSSQERYAFKEIELR